MQISVGGRVVFHAPGKAGDGTEGAVLELRGEHARCQFSDGRIAWVPLVSLSATEVSAASTPNLNAAHTATPVAASAPNNDADPALGWGLLALIYFGLTVIPTGCTLIGAVVFSLPYYLWRKDKPERARQWQKHVWIAFALGIVLWGTIGAIAANMDKKEEASSSLEHSERGSARVRLTTLKTWSSGACELQAPAIWTSQNPPSSPAASLELTSDDGSSLFTIISEPVGDFDPNLGLEDYAKLALAASDFGKLPELEKTRVRLASGPAIKEIRAGILNGVQLTTMVHYVRTREHFHRLIAISPTRLFPALRPVLEQVAVSTRCTGAS